MKHNITISVMPRQVSDELFLKDEIAKILKIQTGDISAIRIVRQSVDARSRNVRFNLGIEVFVGELPAPEADFHNKYRTVTGKPEVVIIGAGPAGLFAALRLIELGLKPVIFERGKDVHSRKRDIAAIHRNEEINQDSNYGFGEGGAGTFSDGKLYTRSKKKGNVNRILRILHYHGAQPEILVESHPHIGTNVLPGVIEKIRETILSAGGEIHFNSRFTGFTISGNQLKGIRLNDGTTIQTAAVILATGHSARDVYYLLHHSGIQLESKNFAVGVRVEHPQQLIDSIQYHRPGRGQYLPAATYAFTEQVDGRGVYSFCMCPGGVIVPAATTNDEMVVNGMSPSGRNGEFANSGIVVEVKIEDLKQHGQYRELAGLKFQEELEKKAYQMAGCTHFAPSQRLNDFINGKASTGLPDGSYRPGSVLSGLHEWLPPFISERLQKGFVQMGKKARGFVTNEAVILGVESRTSSPVRIPRIEETFEHVSIQRLFPCGEGAGYSGGIVSSAIDGELCAEKVAAFMQKNSF